LTGASHHWRKEERESGRDLFLNMQENNRSREYRCAVQESCHKYVREACQRNRGQDLVVDKTVERHYVNMPDSDGEKILQLTADLNSAYGVTPDQLGEKAGDLLSITASSKARHEALVKIITSILKEEPETKIIVFANASYGGYDSAKAALDDAFKNRYANVDDSSSVERQNEVIAWFRHKDVTSEERERDKRILLLSYEQAAGHNLQEACHNVIMFEPMYSGSDAVADASIEEQAIGRVMRQGQEHDVTVSRILVKGPSGEDCVDNWVTDRNEDEEVLKAATSNFDD